MIHHDLIIVGGGASGLSAAITAKDFGLDVAIVEGTDRIGKKILTTGNGRCNISNRTISFPFLSYHSENPGFFTNVLSSFSVNDTENFFLSLGLPIVELKNGKMYPKSLQASSVVDILKLALEDRSIPLYTDCKVKDIHKKNVFKLSTSNEENNLAKSFGHSLIKTIPGIVQLKLSYPYLKSITGVKFDGYATLLVDGEPIRKEFGEILFTDYGISGPPILQISGHASKALLKKKNIEIIVDMMPNQSLSEIEDFMESHFAMFSHRPVINSLIGIVNKKLIPTLLKEAKIENLHKPCYDLQWDEKKRLINLLKNWKFKCIDTNGFNQAQVTIGGINTKEVDPKTLESKLVKNLYFCGEILDVDGDCGGFNLHWAWSSGNFVSKNIANS